MKYGFDIEQAKAAEYNAKVLKRNAEMLFAYALRFSRRRLARRPRPASRVLHLPVPTGGPARLRPEKNPRHGPSRPQVNYLRQSLRVDRPLA